MPHILDSLGEEEEPQDLLALQAPTIRSRINSINPSTLPPLPEGSVASSSSHVNTRVSSPNSPNMSGSGKVASTSDILPLDPSEKNLGTFTGTGNDGVSSGSFPVDIGRSQEAKGIDIKNAAALNASVASGAAQVY